MKWMRAIGVAADTREFVSSVGSNSGRRKVFADAALELGDELVKRKMDLVYGGGNVGLMGLISQNVFDGGCSVLGYPAKPLEKFGLLQICTKERLRWIVKQTPSSLFPEDMEPWKMITSSWLGIHKKLVTHDSFISIRFDTLNFRPMILWVILTAPIGLLNVDGYYDSFLSLFDNGVKEGFIRPTARNIVLSAPTAEELINKLEEFTPFNEHVAPHESWKMQQLGDYSRQ